MAEACLGTEKPVRGRPVPAGDDMSEGILLIATVGGTPEPIVAALKGCRPERVIFVVSPETREKIERDILPLAQREGLDLSAGRYDAVEIADAQDFTACLEGLRIRLAEQVESWLSRGRDYGCVVDFTGGTKCMSAALVSAAHRWLCRFSYVGATSASSSLGSEERRTKGGVGIVVSGKEQVFYSVNPSDALGYQAVEEAVALFDRHAFQAAARRLSDMILRMTHETRKRELLAFKSMVDAFDAWDRFDHKRALHQLRECLKKLNDLKALFTERNRRQLDDLLPKLIKQLEFLEAAGRKPTKVLVCDLLANARRRADEGRYDDAVARVYRSVEAVAQMRLLEGYDIPVTGRVPADRLPPTLADRWACKAEDNEVRLGGLQDDYLLLKELNDPLGLQFAENGWTVSEGSPGSPLDARNNSILAHGFDPVPQGVFDDLWKGCLQLADVKDHDLPRFPRLGMP